MSSEEEPTEVQRLVQPSRGGRLVAGLAAILVAVAFAGWVVGSAINSNGQTAANAQDFARRIQSERLRSIAANCKATNERHDKTIETLDKLIARVPPGSRRDRAEASRASTILLINALVPKQDCAALVRRARVEG
jgi:hypothetical protein